MTSMFTNTTGTPHNKTLEPNPDESPTIGEKNPHTKAENTTRKPNGFTKPTVQNQKQNPNNQTTTKPEEGRPGRQRRPTMTPPDADRNPAPPIQAPTAEKPSPTAEKQLKKLNYLTRRTKATD